MNVLSLFDGISCGQVALQRSGIKVHNYYASEIDKYAIKIAQHNWPNTIQLGDVTKWKDWNIDWKNIDLLCAGFPCQAWSLSGERRGINDPRGALAITLFEIFTFLKEKNPNLKFLFENVKMKNQHVNYLSDLFGVRPIEINSSSVSALNRTRLYWTNLSISQVPELNVTWKDIKEDFVHAKYFLSKTALERLDNIEKRAKIRGLGYKKCFIYDDSKFLNLDASFYKGPDGKRGVVWNGGSPRMPTPIECERLQTLPDNYTIGLSDTQRYKVLGNGWTISVIELFFYGKR